MCICDNEKIYDFELPLPKFKKFDEVLYKGVHTEISSNYLHYSYNEEGIMCPWYYVPILVDDAICIELIPETDLIKF